MCRCAGRGNVHCVGGKLQFDFDICHSALLMLHALSGLITDVLHLKPEAPEPELEDITCILPCWMGNVDDDLHLRSTWTGTLAAELGDWTTPLPAPQLPAPCALYLKVVCGGSPGESRNCTQRLLSTRSCTAHSRTHAVCLALRRQLLVASRLPVPAHSTRRMRLLHAQHPCPLSGPNRQGVSS